eukprot:NODE_5554_length_568_cov_9.874759_g4824_i0.p2 GENE.NODE_5554_length_568_cov_9.874759_g4824_i0~~NODE_5554_length_568_cov_9.874759_g4824_i0.p2  ORF type:complete len:167 (-),score=26.78 NODE_5554_length_568_cov_9.874759_g4824_i0:67-546(-)
MGGVISIHEVLSYGVVEVQLIDPSQDMSGYRTSGSLFVRLGYGCIPATVFHPSPPAPQAPLPPLDPMVYTNHAHCISNSPFENTGALWTSLSTPSSIQSNPSFGPSSLSSTESMSVAMSWGSLLNQPPASQSMYPQPSGTTSAAENWSLLVDGVRGRDP